MKLRQTPPQDGHEEAILAEIRKAEAALRRAHELCVKRASARTEDGQSLRLRYKDTQRSLEVVLDATRSIRGFGPMPQVRETNAKP